MFVRKILFLQLETKDHIFLSWYKIIYVLLRNMKALSRKVSYFYATMFIENNMQSLSKSIKVCFTLNNLSQSLQVVVGTQFQSLVHYHKLIYHES